jgi:DnaJ-class molecular chaperone
VNIEIKAAIPIEWDKTYYFVGSADKNVYAPCRTCDGTGKVTIKEEQFDCPRCHGNWREKEVVSKTKVYHVEKYRLERIEVRQDGIRLQFNQINSNLTYGNTVNVRAAAFDTMKVDNVRGGNLTDDHAAIMAEVKRLNAEVRTEVNTQ